MQRNDIMYEFHIGSKSFLSRAIAQLDSFDKTGAVGDVFQAALSLRFGIEARLCEYIDAELRTLKRETEDYKEYVAVRLLSKLQDLNARAAESISVKLTNNSSGHVTSLTYTPVTRELAQMHGKLGELLHFKFFRNNPNWFYKVPVEPAKGKSLAEVRTFLEEVKNELRKATTGLLLSHPSFTPVVAEIADSMPGENESRE